MNIDKKYDDDMFVCKFGYTADLLRRTKEHMKDFNKIKGAVLTLKYYSQVDSKYI
jgi:hypothetical protein